ncbi:MAG: sugar phosphate isomerase/epimerase family protein [Bryobacteraceae bacterium]
MNRRNFFKSIPAAALPLGLTGAPAAGAARLRSAICAYSFREQLKNKTMSYDDIVRLAVETGIDGLDLTVYWFPNTSDEFLLPLRRLAFRNSVDLYSISVRTEMCRPTPQEQAAEVATIKGWVDAAEKLGAGHIRVFGGRVPQGATDEQAADWCAEVLKRGGEYAGKHGVILGLENHGGITSRAERIIQIVKKVDSPWVAVNLDTGNFNSDPWTQIEMCIPHAVNVQVKAEMRGPDGKKAAGDWERVTRMLVKGGYRGYLALEYEAAEPAPTAVPRLVRQLHALTRKYSA